MGKDSDALAHRPALADVQERQARVLVMLQRPIARAEVPGLVAEISSAAVGRVGPLVRALFHHRYLSEITAGVLARNDAVGRHFRDRLRVGLTLEFSGVIRDLTGMTKEAEVRGGSGSAAVSFPQQETNFR